MHILLEHAANQVWHQASLCVYHEVSKFDIVRKGGGPNPRVGKEICLANEIQILEGNKSYRKMLKEFPHIRKKFEEGTFRVEDIL